MLRARALPMWLHQVYWIEGAESVNESRRDKNSNSLALFNGEAGVSLILFWPCDIDFGVGGIVIATSNDWLRFFEVFEII